MDTPKRIALVIGSGSVKCAAAIGLQNVLQRHGFKLSLVVGCSGGSMYAACLALGWEAATITEITKRLWTEEITQQRDTLALFKVVLPQVFGFNESFGMLQDRLIMQRLQTAYGERTFADTQIPLYITATDFMTGEQVILSEGKIREAIRGSIAMPYIFTPHKVNDRLLVDGYLSDPMPVGTAIREGADVIVAMGFDSPYQHRINSLQRFSSQVSSIMANNLFKANFAFHSMAHHGEVISIIPEFKERIRLFDTEKIPMIIEEGERATEAQIPYLKRLMEASN